MRAVVAVVVRVLGVGALAYLAGWLMTVGESDAEVGANIGAGIAAFLIIMAAAFVWAFVDRAKGEPAGRVILVWVAVGVVLGVASAVQASTPWDGLTAEVLLSDLTQLAPFVAGLVFVPALVGAGAGHLLRR